MRCTSVHFFGGLKNYAKTSTPICIYVFGGGLLGHNQKTLQVCWMCNATKGNDGCLDYAYTNTSCKWKETLYQDPPYDDPPILTTVFGWDNRMLHPDLLHVWHLGVGRDLLGTAIMHLIKKRLIFPGRTIDIRLAAASRSLRNFAQTNRYNLSRRKLNKQCLNWKTGEYPELKTKGYDTAIIGMWLNELVENNDIGNNDLSTAIWSSNNVLTILAKSDGYFLTEEEEKQVVLLGELFCDTYLRLAYSAVQQGQRLYRTRPKFHILQHVFCLKTPGRLNLQRYSTWMEEDANKKFIRINKATHRVTAAQRVLQRWLLGVPSTFAKLEKKRKTVGSFQATYVHTCKV